MLVNTVSAVITFQEGRILADFFFGNVLNMRAILSHIMGCQ